MKKTLIFALLCFGLGILGNAQTVEGVINGPHITIPYYNNWGAFCNNMVLVQQKNNAVKKHFLYATNYNPSSLYIPGIDKFFDNGEEVIVTNLNINIKDNGNLGIGTKDADASLKIYNSNPFNSGYTINNQDHILLNAPDPGNDAYFSAITWQSGGRRRASIVATREHEDADYIGLAFFTQGTDGPGPMYESMRLTRNGMLGIGITNPSDKLHVNGTIRATEIKVVAQTADFVFEEDYQLKPLEEVEQFITNNKHLPDIPSAKQMEEDGVGLAEMNKLLLQKVEELTLYVIEQQKEIIQLKAKEEKITDLEKAIDLLNQKLSELK